MRLSSAVPQSAEDPWLPGLDGTAILDRPLMFTWPLAGPFGAVLLGAMMWLAMG